MLLFSSIKTIKKRSTRLFNNSSYYIITTILKNFFFLKNICDLKNFRKINFSLFRRFLWKKVSKNIIVTSPTEETKKKLIDKKIFPENRINLVKDPILENFEKIDKLKINVSRRKKFLAVGRLTKQKNFIF